MRADVTVFVRADDVPGSTPPTGLCPAVLRLSDDLTAYATVHLPSNPDDAAAYLGRLANECNQLSAVLRLQRVAS